MKKQILSSIVTLFLSTNSFSQEAGRISAEIIGTRNNPKATLICFIFDSKEAFLKESKALQVFDAKVGTSEAFCEFDVPMNKEYAIAVLQDENANRILDKNILGSPKEGWGTSNNVTHTFKAPDFQESKVLLNGKILNIKISMHY